MPQLNDWHGVEDGPRHAADDYAREAERPNDGKGGCCQSYSRLVCRLRFVLVVVWLCVGGVGAWLGPKFLGRTKDAFEAPSGTQAAEARQKWQELYPHQANSHTLIVLAHAQDGSSLLNNETHAREWSEAVELALIHEFNASSPTLEHASSYGGVTGYFSIASSLAPSLARIFVSADEATLFWTISFEPPTDGSEEDVTVDIARHVRKVVHQLDTKPEVYSLGVTGVDLTDLDISDGSAEDMLSVDMIILPIALGVLCLFLKSLRLMVLPLLSLALSLVSAFTIMLPISSHINVASFAPSIMMSLCLAMSIDYSLFMLTRYREEILSGLHRREKDAVAVTVRRSGEVILASGCTLAITFASLCAFPMAFLSSIGMGAALTIACCLIVNLTFVPAALFLFPAFFADFTIPSWIRYVLPSFYIDDVPLRRFGDDGLDDAFVAQLGLITLDQELLYTEPEDIEARSPKARSVNDEPADTSFGYSVRHAGIGIAHDGPAAARHQFNQTPCQASMRARQQKSFWYKSAVLSTSTPASIVILLVVLGCAVPFLLSCINMKHTIDENQLLPRGADSVVVYEQVQKYLSPGLISQYQIMVQFDPARLPTPPAPSPIGVPLLNGDYFNVTSMLVSTLLDRGLASNTSLNSVVYNDGVWTRTPLEAVLMLIPGACLLSEAACIYTYRFNEAINNGTASTCSLITLTTPFAPLGDQAEPFLRDLRQVLAEFQAFSDLAYGGAITLFVTGGATEAADAVERIYELFPYVILSTVGIVLLLAAIAFRSLIVPLRLVFSLAVPLCYTYGLAIMVFQENRADWAGKVVAHTHSLYWLVPVMSFSILVGLSLDYDFFLFFRIFEYRSMGFSTTASIRKGVYHTGGVISGAGLIMAIAFGGLMLSRELVLNSFGFMLTFAVIFDTFVVRTFAVPAMLHLAGELNWFPNCYLPEPTKSDFDLDDEEEAVEVSSDERSLEYSFR